MECGINLIPSDLHIIQSFGYVMLDLDKDLFAELKQNCFDMEQKNFDGEKYWNVEFYANLPQSYQLNTKLIKKIENFLNNKAMPSYWNEWKDNREYPKIKIQNDEVWAMFQKSGEFVSIHNHTKRFSFVIWINLPYNSENLNRNYNSSKTEPPGTFGFILPNFLNRGGLQKHNIPLNKNYEGKMIIFPSFLNHYVTPFYDEKNQYRISIAGNFSFINE